MKNYIVLDGEQIKISDETAENLKKQISKKEPLPIQIGTLNEPDDRVFITLTASMLSFFKNAKEGKIIVISKYGDVTNNWNPELSSDFYLYKNVRNLGE